ncbi:unnamed protein product, partial [Phaeothamnion confervicola]
MDDAFSLSFERNQRRHQSRSRSSLNLQQETFNELAGCCVAEARIEESSSSASSQILVEAATNRLQDLLHECLAEYERLRRATSRAEAAFEEALDAQEAEELQRMRWQLFCLRLEWDTASAVNAVACDGLAAERIHAVASNALFTAGIAGWVPCRIVLIRWATTRASRNERRTGLPRRATRRRSPATVVFGTEGTPSELTDLLSRAIGLSTPLDSTLSTSSTTSESGAGSSTGSSGHEKRLRSRKGTNNNGITKIAITDIPGAPSDMCTAFSSLLVPLSMEPIRWLQMPLTPEPYYRIRGASGATSACAWRQLVGADDAPSGAEEQDVDAARHEVSLASSLVYYCVEE